MKNSRSDSSRGRPLTRREQDVLEVIVAKAPAHGEDVLDADRRRWAEQIPSLRVLATCRCGCPTVNFTDDDAWSRRLVLSATTEGLGLILFIDDDQLSCLEVYSVDGSTVTDFPPPDAIQF